MAVDVPDSVESSPLRQFLEDYALLIVVGVAAVLAVVGVSLFFLGDEAFVKDLLDRYGYLALFSILILEGAMLLYFAPSESLVPLGIAFIADSTVESVAVVLVAVAGATVGQYVLFVLAKRGGREWLLQKPWFRIGEDRLERFDRAFERWGWIAVPVSNALLFTRGMLTVPAGFAEMDAREFVVLSAIGSLIFQTWLALLWIYLNQMGFFSFI
ncbi:MAG TPA: VTT domain-containing protein [Natrialbaceae archaeon]|nr:VTT domain-containing protein [Natrialbaceae archaeon]